MFKAKIVNTAPDAPTARHTAPHKNGGEPHQKSVPAPPKSTHSSCPSSRTPRRHFSTAKSCAKRRLHACILWFPKINPLPLQTIVNVV